MARLRPAAAEAVPHPAAAWVGYFHLLVVYLVWGSTYLAIRVAVRPGAGFPPFALGATRLLLAGGVLLLWAAWARHRLRPSRRELATLLASGILLWVGGNGLVMWGEQRADSGYAALLVGSAPIWVAVAESLLDRRAPSALLAASLLVGFAGLGVLTAPSAGGAHPTEPSSVLALMLAPVSWGLGTLLLRRRAVGLTPLASSAYQQLFGGLAFATVAALLGEPAPRPAPDAWLAWAYLVVFGSLLAFTSFVQAVRLLPTRVVMTYAYVNPVIAVVLGRLLLDEPVTLRTLGGAALVLLGVAGVFRSRGRP